MPILMKAMFSFNFSNESSKLETLNENQMMPYKFTHSAQGLGYVN